MSRLRAILRRPRRAWLKTVRHFGESGRFFWHSSAAAPDGLPWPDLINCGMPSARVNARSGRKHQTPCDCWSRPLTGRMRTSDVKRAQTPTRWVSSSPPQMAVPHICFLVRCHYIRDVSVLECCAGLPFDWINKRDRLKRLVRLSESEPHLSDTNFYCAYGMELLCLQG